jgi:putative cell wall-binding protein
VLVVACAIVAATVVLAPHGADAEPRSYALGSLDGQHGWNGGIGGFVNNESGAEGVTTVDSFSGERSWRYGRGYGSPGQGTPYSPVAATVGRPSSGAAGDVAILRLAFRAVAPGDGSLQSVYLGSEVRNDRTAMHLSLRNLGGGVELAMSRMSGVGCNTESIVIATVPGATWHTVEMRSQLHEDVDRDVTTYIIDGVEVANEVAWPMPWRVCNGFDYTPGSSIKFMSTSPNTPAYSGFYYDDLSLQVVSSSAAATVGFFGTGFEGDEDVQPSAIAPGAPTAPTAVAGTGQATVTFSPPASNGGSAITGYTVVSNPAGGVDTNAGSTGLSHVVTGLTNGTSYTFTVVASSAAGAGSPSAASNSVVPLAPTTTTTTTTQPEPAPTTTTRPTTTTTTRPTTTSTRPSSTTVPTTTPTTIRQPTTTTPAQEAATTTSEAIPPARLAVEPVQERIVPGEPVSITAPSDTTFDDDVEPTVTMTGGDADGAPVVPEVTVAVVDGRLTVAIVVPVGTPEQILVVTITAVDARGVERTIVSLFAVESPPSVAAAGAIAKAVAAGSVGVVGERLAGADRYGTARAVIEATFDAAGVVLLVSGRSPADALAATYLAGVSASPILLTEPDRLPDGLLATLDSLGAAGVLVIGGTGAVSDAVLDDLRGEGYVVDRIAGENRYSTARLVSERVPREVIGSFMRGKAAIVVNGRGLGDAIVAAPLAAAQGLPIVLTEPERLHADAEHALLGLGIEQVLIIGDAREVSEAVGARIDSLGIDVRRIGGASPQETALRLAEVAVGELRFPADRVLLARVGAPADALVGGIRGGTVFAPILLTDDRTTLGLAASSFLVDHGATISTIEALGGDGVVAQAVLDLAVALASRG